MYRIYDMMNPMDLEPYEKKDFDEIKKRYLLYGDFILGAAFMGERRLVVAYTRTIGGTIVYGEDCAYTIMIADDIHIGFWNQNFVWYEFGTGISMSTSDKWLQRLAADIGTCSHIIDAKHPDRPAALERLRAENPGKKYLDIRQDYTEAVCERNRLENRSYLKNVDPDELEKLVHGKVVFDV